MAKFNSYVSHYQRVTPENPMKSPFSHGFPMVFLWFSQKIVAKSAVAKTHVPLSSAPRMFRRVVLVLKAEGPEGTEEFPRSEKKRESCTSCIYTYMNTYAYAMYITYIYIYICNHMYMHVQIYIYIYIYYIYIYM